MTLHPFSNFSFELENALSPSRCKELIEMGRQKGFAEAPLHDAFGNEYKADEHRKNHRVIIESEDLAAEFWESIKYVVPTEVNFCKPIGLNSYLRFYEYNEGHFFRRHKDRPLRLDNGDYSIFTVLLYLNDGFVGGETGFDGFQVVPQTGLAVIFNHRMFHESFEITQGTKYAIRSDVIYRPMY